MIWQDWAFSIGQWFFLAALMPSIFSKNKPALSTSIFTGIVLVMYVATNASLGLWLAAVSTSMTATAWFVLAAQKILNK